MTSKIRDEGAEVLRFGGGINSRASEDQIHPLECTDGQNFTLDPGNGEFRPRGPFDKVATATNGKEIRGFATLLETDGTVTLLVQAGDTVYNWNGLSSFTSVGTVSSTARLRGPKEANWALADKVLITDLNLQEPVMEWNGTALSDVAFLTSDGSTSFGTFRAKYCVVENERAFYANIFESSNDFPHLLVGSERGNYAIVSASDRPSSELSAEDPWFLATPQLKPINGLVSIFGILALSQENGAFEELTGDSAQNFALRRLHAGSGASGAESVVGISNDVIYGSLGKIESLSSTDKFGDVETDDLSFKIQPDISGYDGWTLVYNPSVNRVYCFPQEIGECWVLHTDFIGSELSPWSKWKTSHALDFRPTAAMLCRDPQDGLEYVFMGDNQGNIYRMEGSGESGDGGTASILAYRDSMLLSAPLDAEGHKFNGWIQHRKGLSNDVEMTFKFAGEHVHDVMKTVELTAVSSTTVYGGEVYYGGNFYYGNAEQGRLFRRKWGASGQSNQFQVRLSVSGTNDFSITEVGIRFNVAS